MATMETTPDDAPVTEGWAARLWHRLAGAFSATRRSATVSEIVLRRQLRAAGERLRETEADLAAERVRAEKALAEAEVMRTSLTLMGLEVERYRKMREADIAIEARKIAEATVQFQRMHAG